MTSDAAVRILDVSDETSLSLLPPCADPAYDHRSCDYWEDEVRGSKAARASWLERAQPAPTPAPRRQPDNPFAPEATAETGFNPFDPAASPAPEVAFNPFAPAPRVDEGAGHSAPSKLRLLDRGRAVFGSFAKVLLLGDESVGYIQFGPLSAYPRAQQVRALYPQLPASPLPAVITCIATVPAARGRGLASTLVDAVVADLAGRGFASVETYPDLTFGEDQGSAATPAFWLTCGFKLAVDDERYPVMRRELD